MKMCPCFSKTTVLSILILLIWYVPMFGLVVNAKLINVWVDSSFGSTKAEMDIEKCSNMPPEVAGNVSSINTHNQCARFYDDWNCTGNAIEILAHSPSHYDLRPWNFNDKILSAGPCRNACDITITGNVPLKPFTIPVFALSDFKGYRVNVNVDGCSAVPQHFGISSIITNQTCIQLWTDPNCVSSAKPGEYVYDTIELRPGSPFHNDIGKRWYFFETKAISHCSFKCYNQTVTSTNLTNSTMLLEPENRVVLYDNANFTGFATNVILDIDQDCTNLDENWDVVTVSAKAYNNACIRIFNRWNCEGISIEFMGQAENLTGEILGFDGRTRSLQYCSFNGNKVFGVKFTWIWISAVVVIILIFMTVLLVIFFITIRKLKRERTLSEWEIKKFLEGLGPDFEYAPNRNTGENENVACDANSIEMSCCDNCDDIQDVAINMAYNIRYEIAKKDFTLLLDGKLGMGEFGVVYKGLLNGTKSIAIKTLKPNSSVEHLRSLMKEVKVLLFTAELGDHPNIAKLIGCCTEHLRNGDLFILLEYYSNGSLKSYLRKNREKFYSRGVLNGVADNSKPSARKHEYCNMGFVETSEIPQFNMLQQLKWMIQISCGMEFLSKNKVVHRDLAARNVLLDNHFQAKISDFGLSRKTYNYTSYLMKDNEPVPWRWLPLESIFFAKFSTKSDVWSFAVLCWETFSLGEEPFAGEVWGEEFKCKLSCGYRLPKPEHCPDECYELFLECWSNEASDRPTFTCVTERTNNIYKKYLNLNAQEISTNAAGGYVDTFS